MFMYHADLDTTYFNNSCGFYVRSDCGCISVCIGHAF